MLEQEVLFMLVNTVLYKYGPKNGQGPLKNIFEKIIKL